MKVLGIRFCSVSADAEDFAGFLDKLGLPGMAMQGELSAEDGFMGAVFDVGDSWVELWADAPGMPTGIMLQIVVDDANEFAAHAKANGLDPQGPVDAHGERIFYLQAPTGLQMSFQSRLSGE
jgi:hypothetical protein